MVEAEVRDSLDLSILHQVYSRWWRQRWEIAWISVSCIKFTQDGGGRGEREPGSQYLTSSLLKMVEAEVRDSLDLSILHQVYSRWWRQRWEIAWISVSYIKFTHQVYSRWWRHRWEMPGSQYLTSSLLKMVEAEVRESLDLSILHQVYSRWWRQSLQRWRQRWERAWISVSYIKFTQDGGGRGERWPGSQYLTSSLLRMVEAEVRESLDLSILHQVYSRWWRQRWEIAWISVSYIKFTQDGGGRGEREPGSQYLTSSLLKMVEAEVRESLDLSILHQVYSRWWRQRWERAWISVSYIKFTQDGGGRGER